MGLKITWRLLYLGLWGSPFVNQFTTEDIIDYAIDQLEYDDNVIICKLAGIYPEEKDNIINLLENLITQENSNKSLEMRKIRAVIVYNALKIKNKNYINGLMELNDLWAELGYPKDSPHTIQGKDNEITVEEYYTEKNYNNLYERNVSWLREEMTYIKKNQ